MANSCFKTVIDIMFGELIAFWALGNFGTLLDFGSLIVCISISEVQEKYNIIFESSIFGNHRISKQDKAGTCAYQGFLKFGNVIWDNLEFGNFDSS